jgi:3'-phosphoadenosine 5'-phosphosulfate sulfotransferase (PAPS reductase)/FAD synthetase
MVFNKTILVCNKFIEQEDENIRISFSGGKDSTVLLHFIKNYVYKNIKSVFCNTGLEYPDIIKFVRQFDNID